MIPVGLSGSDAPSNSNLSARPAAPLSALGMIGLGFALLLAGLWPRHPSVVATALPIDAQSRPAGRSEAATAPSKSAPDRAALAEAPVRSVEPAQAAGHGKSPALVGPSAAAIADSTTPAPRDPATLSAAEIPPAAAARETSGRGSKRRPLPIASEPRRSPGPGGKTRTSRPPLEFRFQTGSARVDRSGEPKKLERFLRSLGRCPKAAVLVEGHADAVGDQASNLELSWRRARAVARRLQELGVPEERLVVRAFGHYQPKASVRQNHRAQRRVEVRLSECSSSKKGDAS